MQPGTRFTRPLIAGAAVAVLAGIVASCSGGGEGKHRGTASSGASTTLASAPADADVVLGAGDEVVATVDPRYQSYNIEMVEVTGGTFWQPYDAGNGKVVRPPIDLTSKKLRNLARALGPAYIRVSGSWANSTYFDATGTSGGVAPDGFQGVLTTDEWKGVGAFADAVDGKVTTSFASNAGVRDAGGVWQPDQARALLQFTKQHDIPLVAVELFNEPGLPVGMPGGYSADTFARDFEKFEKLVKEVMPNLKIAGPGTTAEFTPLVVSSAFTSSQILDRVGPAFDVFSFHSYPKVSERCGSPEGPEIALTQQFLSRVETDKKRYEDVRNTYEPAASMWVTETAEAACGGDRWAARYLDVIRYVDTLGRLADGNGDVVFHNTLAASDYGLLDEKGFEPRPDYWAGVLWHRLMGPKVVALEGRPHVADLAVYAHCTPGAKRGDVTYAVVNSSATETRTVATRSGTARVYRLSGERLDGNTISLNGTELRAERDGTLPDLTGRPVSGAIEVAPASVAFVVDDAGSTACR
ncbi:MAG: hypothetical protein U0V73_12635 [Acidimicrobiia bacterium]